MDDLSHLVGFDLLEQRLDPLPRRRSVGSVDLIGHGPEIGIGVEEIQTLDCLWNVTAKAEE